MKVLITGANGFIGKNLKIFLKERSDIEILSFFKEDNSSLLFDFVSKVDFIFHLAGVNRSNDSEEFIFGNEVLTQKLSEAVKKTNRKIPIIYTSSIQAKLDTPYGLSKRIAENILLDSNYNVKLCDFGWSCTINDEDYWTSICGTYEYMSPEIIFWKSHDSSVDIWCLGILLYEFLHGNPPFKGDSITAIKK